MAGGAFPRARLSQLPHGGGLRPHAASIHFLAAIDNGGYFEGDISKDNKFRDELVSRPYSVDAHGLVWPLERPGLGLEVNEEFLRKHPAIDGPGYV